MGDGAGKRIIRDKDSLWTRMINVWNKPIPWFSLPFEIPGTKTVGWEVGRQPSQSLVQLETFQLFSDHKVL